MKVLSAVLLLCMVCQDAWATGAGRAFPLASENLAIQLFTGVNRNLEWDSTNFLVDLSGLYANCDWLGRTGVQQASQPSPEGWPITGIVDNTYGEGMDVDSVNSYISHVLHSWVNNQEYRWVMTEGERFGCSVRPGCSGQVVVSCLFTPGTQGEEPKPEPEQHALAFTDDQYVVAELTTGNPWDRSHFLENLSGFETQCSMVFASQWRFETAMEEANKREMVVLGLFGYAQNRGATQPAMEEILRNFKHIEAKRIGCSVIPDCMRGGQMYVVISCIYQEY